jgi:hypothetical protein
MSTLLDAILGSFNSGQSGGFIPGSLLRDAPSSGYLPEDQVSTPPTDPYGNAVGGPAPGVPLPRPRPPEAGPAAVSPETPDAARLDPRPDESAGVLAAALGLNPDSMRRMSAGLAGGLSNVKNSPFAGQVAANAAGGAFAAGNKSDETAINQALKLRQIELRASRRAIDPSIRLKYADATSEQWYRDRVTALRDEQRAINQSPQTPEEKAAQYKSLRERARALAAEFATIKAQNRRAHGLADDGTPLPQIAASAEPEGAPPSSGE